jgi:hypothetical protein
VFEENKHNYGKIKIKCKRGTNKINKEMVINEIKSMRFVER